MRQRRGADSASGASSGFFAWSGLPPNLVARADEVIE
jgi:hypothetical protein